MQKIIYHFKYPCGYETYKEGKSFSIFGLLFSFLYTDNDDGDDNKGCPIHGKKCK